ncbi:MAG: undecaprenyl-phosphate glucose phosphotransferase [Lamprobacter sp.]|uniref:undecaprenyl-phosphate glucose phosphotransferase n=1 Tax=Lamprobacter sp. TaxID=3100796 RepID=UPI002B2583C5|nr:undecaprenyl-phosphate glucose phosphotransferase [Lamprobacter sp.]MEA3641098.1 undecaprenyl-phosphate glucose phosphotransferase [Lamprobacter sp.]
MADTAAVFLSALLAFLIMHPDVGSTWPWPRYAGAVLLATITFLTYGFANHFYDWRHFSEQIAQTSKAFGAILVAFGALLLTGFMLKWTENFSRLWIGSWFALLSVYILVSRLVLTWYLDKLPDGLVHHRQAIILGAGENGQNILKHLSRFKGHGIKVTGFVDDRCTRLPTNQTKVPLLGGTDELERLVCEKGIDLVIIAMPWSAYDRIRQLLKKLSNWAIDIYMAPEQLGLLYADRPVYRIGGMHVLSLEDRPIDEWHAVIKRAEDLAIALPAVLLLSPFLALVALAIRLESKGNPIFVQKRYGFNNNLIDVYKFRSMYTDLTDINAEKLTERNDPRVTRIGHFIRCTSIDELPQLFNVIQGTMSIVGPRPHATRAKAGNRLYQEAVDLYASRHRVKPGVTGWAQCHGWRGETDTEEKIIKRVEHDLYYINNWSIFLDLLTILKTLKLLFTKDEHAF